MSSQYNIFKDFYERDRFKIHELAKQGKWEDVFSSLGIDPNSTLELLTSNKAAWSMPENSSFMNQMLRFANSLIILGDWVFFILMCWHISRCGFYYAKCKLITFFEKLRRKRLYIRRLYKKRNCYKGSTNTAQLIKKKF